MSSHCLTNIGLFHHSDGAFSLEFHHMIWFLVIVICLLIFYWEGVEACDVETNKLNVFSIKLISFMSLLRVVVVSLLSLSFNLMVEGENYHVSSRIYVCDV